MKNLTGHEIYMHRCFDLASRAAGQVSPNPLVGSVLVYDGRVIGEGFHRKYGDPHAERNAIMSVAEDDLHLIPDSTLYVSLEPCCHHGKTPPCTDLILEKGIKRVFISAFDPNRVVSGKGIRVLESHGVEVHVGLLEMEGKALIRYFRTYMQQHRPHIILKFVQSADGYIGKEDRQVWLSNAYERVMVHKLRSEIDAIMVGTNTAVLDDPELTTRYYDGESPLRVILDRTGRIPLSHHIYDRSSRTRIYSETLGEVEETDLQVIRMPFDDQLITGILADLFALRVQSLMVEGGAGLINSFLKLGLWDEALVVRTPKILESGVKAPLIDGRLNWRYQIADDEVLSILPDKEMSRV